MDTRQIARSMIKITDPTTWTSKPTLGILCGTPGTITGTDADGNAFVALPLQQGFNPISIKALTAATASDIWALY